jgi:methylmalonyl-CoA/ethylmalonyl-CoA epimerase
MFERIDHIGIAVEDIDAALGPWRALGMTVSHREVIASQGVEAALLDAGDGHVELVAPLGPDTPVGRFLSSRGAGLHHVAFAVADIETAVAEARAAGLALIDEQPRVGIGSSRVVFVHPRAVGGVLVEIVEPAHALDGVGGR